MTEVYMRKEMLDGPGTGREKHIRYYTGIVEACGGWKAFRIPFTPEQVAAALEAGDEHLNTLPLRQWDAATDILPLAFRRVLKERGDTAPSLGDGVCALKRAAHMRHADLKDAAK